MSRLKPLGCLLLKCLLRTGTACSNDGHASYLLPCPSTPKLVSLSLTSGASLHLMFYAHPPPPFLPSLCFVYHTETEEHHNGEGLGALIMWCRRRRDVSNTIMCALNLTGQMKYFQMSRVLHSMECLIMNSNEWEQVIQMSTRILLPNSHSPHPPHRTCQLDIWILGSSALSTRTQPLSCRVTR